MDLTAILTSLLTLLAGIGVLGTAAIQSSGATTVMTIGFVNAGIISLAQAATIIYGANIGTTVTAQISLDSLKSGLGTCTASVKCNQLKNNPLHKIAYVDLHRRFCVIVC
jgi:hypothetical protein